MNSRPLTPIERLYLAAEKSSGPVAIQFLCHGEGELSVEELEAAVASVAKSSLGTMLDKKGRLWVASSRATPIKIIDSLDYSAPLAAGSSEIHYLRNVHGLTLLFRVHHTLMDAQGVLLWMRNIFKALRSEAVIPTNFKMTDERFLNEQSSVKKRQTSLPRFSSPLSVGERDVVLQEFFEGNKPGLSAKLMHFLAQMSSLPCSLFMVPVDLRRHFLDCDSTANLTLPVFIPVEKVQSWQEIQTQLLRKLESNDEISANRWESALLELPTIMNACALRLLDHAQRIKNKYCFTAFISHLGKIEKSWFSAPQFKLHRLIPRAIPMTLSPLSFVIVECEGQTEMSVAANHTSTGEVQSLLRSFWKDFSPGRGRVTKESLPTVVELFKSAAANFPGHTALQEGKRKISYRELDELSGDAAKAIAEKGMKGQDIIVVDQKRSIELVVQILGILKLGASYLPVDPSAPQKFKEKIHRELETLRHDAKDRAYVIFTSGSTGRPKGVSVGHESLSNYLIWASEAYQVNEDSNFALFTSIAFDLTVTSIFLPLIKGGTLHLYSETNVSLLLAEISSNTKINKLKLTPAHLQIFNQLQQYPPSLETLIVGGDRLRVSVALKALELARGVCQIYNEYGPTEATVGCVVHRFDPQEDSLSDEVPIGQPIMNCEIKLIEGEIIISGRCLAQGYLGGEDFTSYATGDLAEWVSGKLHFKGRRDHQIKLNGFRIEPGIIEEALCSHPEISVALVRVSRQTLIAYYQSTNDLKPQDLRDFLAKQLSDYMVPWVYIRLTEFPLNQNGKVDISLLPALEVESPLPDMSGLEGIGGVVSLIWQRQLEVTYVSLSSNFYELGGSSLDLLEMLSQVSEELLGQKIDDGLWRELASLVEHPTLEKVITVFDRRMQRNSR
ncbi:MAG: non-ribosomal peptide synthetase [Proteobacteria bacterium]|nr:non-ribosomal peptide synthetase [Pseudomonadota bacterium]